MDTRDDLQLAFSLPCPGRQMVGRNGRRLLGMRKSFALTLMLILSVPVLASDNEEARIKAAVEDVYKQWLAAANKKDAAALTDLYDENAVLMPKQEEPEIGKPAIGEYYKKLVANPQFVPFTLTLNWNSFHLVGDIAIATSVFEGDVTRNGKQIHFRGKNLLVWKKQADGSWKIFRYMFDEIPAKK
jgi:Ketosteroid isomerase homolog